MTSPHYRGEGGENTRHRVTGGVSVPVVTGSDRAGGGEAIFFLGTQTQLGSQTRVGYAGWCTKGTEEC